WELSWMINLFVTNNSNLELFTIVLFISTGPGLPPSSTIWTYRYPISYPNASNQITYEVLTGSALIEVTDITIPYLILISSEDLQNNNVVFGSGSNIIITQEDYYNNITPATSATWKKVSN